MVRILRRVKVVLELPLPDLMDANMREAMQSKQKSAGAKAERGFTLVEVMIAVVIVGMLAALVTPTVSRTIKENNTRGLNRQIVQAFQEARSYAMGRGEVVFVAVDRGQDQGAIRFFRSDNRALDCSEGVVAPPAIGEGLTSVDLNNTGLEHAIMGADPAAEGTLARPLCISPSGRVLDRDGRVLRSDGGCPGYNFRFWMANPEATLDATVTDCPAMGVGEDELFDLSVQRQLSSFYMIHIPFSGQARVIQ